MRTICDTVLWLRGEASEKPFPIVQFSGDTDMLTEGWASFTSTEGSEIVVAQLTGEEYRATFESTEGYVLAERRVNQALGRGDLKRSWFVRVAQAVVQKGASFSAFRRASLPTLLFRDIFGAEGVAKEIGRVSLAEFEQGGGKFSVLQ